MRNWKKKLSNSRIYFVGSYLTNMERTSLSDKSSRNVAILQSQYTSFNLILQVLSNGDFRSKHGITDQMYIEILKTTEWEVGDRDFSAATAEDEFDLEKFQSFSSWPTVRKTGQIFEQIHQPLASVHNIRESLGELIQNDDSEIKKWAIGHIEPTESCLLLTNQDVAKAKFNSNFYSWKI